MYGHLSTDQLETLRDKLQAAYTARLMGPTVAMGAGRRVEYQGSAGDLKRELQAVIGEIERRSGRTYGGPIYPVNFPSRGRFGGWR
jgi:hypothetical protein